MSGMGVVRRQELGKALSRGSFRAVVAIWAAFFVVVPAVVFSRIAGSPLLAAAGEEAGRALRQYFIDIYVTRYTFVLIVMASGGLLTEAFLREKMERTLEALLATPLTIRDVWLGKSLALLQIGCLYALGVCAAYLVVVSVMTGAPAVPGPWAIATALVGVPLVSLGLFCLAGLLELTTSGSRAIHLILFGVGFVLMWTTFRTPPGALPRLGPGLLATYLAAAAALGLAIAVLASRLTKEKAILG